MDIEWARTVEGRVELSRLLDAVFGAAAPSGVTNLDWSIRRATYRKGEITYRFDSGDDRDKATAMYKDDLDAAYLSLVVYHAESRDTSAHAQVDFDGSQTRVKVEAGSSRMIERMIERFG